ncbi:phosphate/phosphite/phosphonate ABC transporter substrate-binding protein [Leptothrix discophora]|uniref:Phosphate/phosphite/phosphonate ABC transporter substrate-binding protein n=1 Tax=Leptothrix discophora TaxID=89 RepID=A0ABT9G3C8_LEPDI|nr:phosphate/phosphite/phosphonate ABC transporter substrate-binding protein [Leptothrix discophora]MDP4300979.1 phosphate/phosphite/phosphonate ABC transporter substrate-binding protein [Leptothrix discophora]
MTLQLTVSPDFSPDHIAGWYVFNTWLQRRLGERIHLELFENFDAQRAAIEADRIDLIYANPYDAAMLVRQKGFVALAAPRNLPDEVVIAVPVDASAQQVEDLKPGTRLAVTSDPVVNLIGMITLASADLNASTTLTQMVGSYVLVAKLLLQGKADAGFFLSRAWHSLSPVVRRQLRPLVTSDIGDVRHVLLAGPRAAHLLAPLRELLPTMDEPGADGRAVLEALGLEGFMAQDAEATEFMIDLMDTLKV